MKLFTCLLLVGVWSMLINVLVLGQSVPSVTWSAQAANPIKEYNTGDYFTTNGGPSGLSGVVDHSPGTQAGYEILYTTSGSSSAGYSHSLARTSDGDYYVNLQSYASQPSFHPYIVRLTNNGTGTVKTRNYVFSSLSSDPNTLNVDLSNLAPSPTGFITLNTFPSRTTVYTGIEPIRSVSATVLNDIIYIAIGWLNSGKISIISTPNMVNFTDQGYAMDDNNLPIKAESDISLFAAKSPNTTQTSGTLFLYHACSTCQTGSLAARVIRALDVTTSPIIFGTGDQVIVNDAQIVTMTGTAVAVGADYQTVLIVRTGLYPRAPSGSANSIFYAILNTSPLSRTQETYLVDSSTNLAAQTSVTPAVIYDRIAGNSATSGPVSIVWSNSDDNLLYSVVGNPF